MAKSGKVTIRTVAEDAGVSVAAVSKVIRNAYGVSDSLREKVLSSVDKLGYRPSTAARGMRGRTYTVGLLIVKIDNPFLQDLIDGMNNALAEENYQAMIGTGRGTLTIETALIESMIDYKMDGLILIAPRISGKSLDKYAKQIPMVVVGHHEPDARTFDTVNSNDRLGARMAVSALIESGHTRIDMLSLPERPNTFLDVYRERELGYLEVMNENHLDDHVRIFRATETPGRVEADIHQFLNQARLPTAVFCWSDLHAVPLVNAASELGIRVPEDLVVIGYDNSPVARLPIVGLSSMDQDAGELGRLAASTLIERIGGRTDARHRMIDPTLIKRRSFSPHR